MTASHSTRGRLREAGRAVFGIDLRSLAFFRMAVALLLLADLAIRAADLRVMYTDGGMFPRAEMKQWFHPVWSWSFHSWGGSAGYETALFVLAGLFALALLAGFHTRIAVIGSWLMLISIQHRVQPIISGAEILLRLLLFWAMFLPLGRKWSWDARRAWKRGTVPSNTSVMSVATAAILVQMGFTWLCSAIFKTNDQWLHGEALALIFTHDFYASPPATFLLQYPALLKVLTLGAYAVEWSALLLFVPGWPRLRLLVIAVLALLHIGIGICLEVGLFAWVSLTGLILFLPAELWERRLSSKRSRSAPNAGVAGIESCTLPAFARTACLVCFGYVVLVNLSTLPRSPLAALSPERWMPLSKGLGLAQRWGMFEEAPSKDGWCVAWAKLADGSAVDLLRHGAPVEGTRPAFPARLYPNHYWQKLFRELAYTDAQGFQLFRPPVCRFLCRDWNARNSSAKQVTEFELIYSIDPPDGGTAAPLRENLLHLNALEL